MGVGALLGSLIATQVRPSRPLLMVALGEGLLALPLAFLAATSAVAVIAVGALLSGIGLMLGMSVWESTLQRHIPREALSRVTSYDWFGSAAFFMASLLALVAVPDVLRLPWVPAPVAETGSEIIIVDG